MSYTCTGNAFRLEEKNIILINNIAKNPTILDMKHHRSILAGPGKVNFPRSSFKR